MTGSTNFGSDDASNELRRALEKMVRTHERNKQEEYTCGNCAAYPCFRQYSESTPAGLCFQHVRQCRQECANYSYEESPAPRGVCKIDKQKVSYCEECHIPDFKKSRL